MPGQREPVVILGFMDQPLPPHLQLAYDQLSASLESIERRPLDLIKEPWQEIEKSVVKLLGGAFNLERGDHQGVALGLAGAFALRLAASDNAFWFPNRESPEAVMIGFPEALGMLSPFSAVLEALRQSRLSVLEEITLGLRKSQAAAKFSLSGAGAVRLGAEDYRRLFDPGFVHFARIDPQKMKTTLAARPDVLIRDVREALGRVGPEFPQDARRQFEDQVAGALQRLDNTQAMEAQMAAVPRVGELVLHLFATVRITGAAPEEFWSEAAFPLLYIGAPPMFPPLEQKELELVKGGVDPLALFLDLVPYQQPTTEDGILGIFDMESIFLPFDQSEAGAPPRLLGVKQERVKKVFDTFNPKASEDAVERFIKYVSDEAKVPAKLTQAGKQMLEVALKLLSDLKKLIDEIGNGTGELYMRRLTEAEASSEGALSMVRKALTGPRIIL